MLMLFVSACKKNFSSDQFEDGKLVVLAEISALDTVKIPIGKTIKVENGSLIRFEKVNDATVTITENNTTSWVLQPNYSAQYINNPTSVFTNKKRFKAGASYRIDINHPTLGLVSATTYIPLLPRLNRVDTFGTQFNGKEVLGAKITWRDSLDLDEYYIIEAVKELVKNNHFFIYRGKRYSYDEKSGKDFYETVKSTPGLKVMTDTVSLNKYTRLDLFTEDDQSENAKIDKLSNPFRRIFFLDHFFNGETYNTTIYIDKQFFVDPKQKGRVRLQLKSVSKDLYDYLKLYEKYKTDFGSVPTTQLVSPTGNVDNGLGVFGGSAKRERLYYFDVLL
ncbi:hypothetical protein Niako_3974 [Niastella koreensis GR20-10]|uniref:DUF4249 domain-containing protein n=1 Tax=Niastella koreensis (strain DSM 17620 / KACC 11465 / NBRC 106392 / GR20-10) TaxID=700598 RepID=G8T9R4_NIAKG|nr:hypothetical protein Niako_3974 [Niastella koreensis GR20-10]